MTDTESSVWSPEQRVLWNRIQSHPFESPEQGIDFSRRLAREQAWSLAHTRKAIEEYRRYCFLSCVSPTPLTPSVAVDEVWHLHLIHSRDYWERFCGETLGRTLHHAPTRGGAGEVLRHREQYAQTLALYEEYFGPASHQLWPTTAELFAPQPRTLAIDPARYWLIPKPTAPTRRQWAALLVLLAASLGASQAFALDANPFDWNGSDFLILFLVLIVVAAIASTLLRKRARDLGGGDGSQLSPYGIAYLADGTERCLDAAVAQLLASDGAEWDGTKRALVIKKRGLHMDPPLDAVARLIENDGKPESMLRRAKLTFDPIRHDLSARRLLLDEASAWRTRWLGALPWVVLAGIGIVKITIGIGRDRPVAFLVILTIGVGIAALVQIARTPTRSVAGDEVLRLARQRHARTTRAPKNNELGLAVALVGTAALSGTAFAQYHTVRQPPSTSDSSSSTSNSSSDSSSDSGGGGGGCGGCGGGGD